MRLAAASLDPIAELYSGHHGWLHAWLKRKLGCSHRAEDLAHDTFLRLLGQRTVPDLAEPRALLTHIAKGLMIGHWRRQQVEHIPARSLTAVVGCSGAGKSTLLHMIARLWDVNAGAIRIGGVDVRDFGTEALHRHIAMVFQNVVLFSGTVRDNLLVGKADATQEELVIASRRAGAHEFIERLPQGYDTPLGEGGARLSGGERQRLSIARAFLKDALILLLDAATASVDPSGAIGIQRALSELVKDRTVVVIAHRLRSVQHAD